jgi:hypothetical protein
MVQNESCNVRGFERAYRDISTVERVDEKVADMLYLGVACCRL